MTVNFITQAQRDSIVELYVGYFNRAPEAAGLNSWSTAMMTSLNAGNTEAAALASIANQFYDAGVQYNIFSAAQPVASFITTAYANALGRTSVDAAGMTYWTAKLNSGEVSRGAFVQTLIRDAKAFAGDATWGWVATYMANRVAVGNAFADSSTSLTGTAAIAAGISALSTVTPALAQSGQTAAQAVTAFNTTAVTGQTFTLTTGIDSAAVAGTAGNDTFNATGATFSAGDVLTGGLGADVLNINDITGASVAAPANASVTGIETVNLSSTGTIGAVTAAAAAVPAVAASTAVATAASQVQTITFSASTATTLTATINGVVYTTTGVTATPDGAATALAAMVNAALGLNGAGTASAVATAGAVVITSPVSGTALPTITTAGTGATSASVATTANAQISQSSVAIKEVITITLVNTTTAAETVYINGQPYAAGASGANATTAAAAAIVMINAVLGAGVATAVAGVITITAPVAGVALPQINVTGVTSSTPALIVPNQIATTAAVAAIPAVLAAGGTAYDVSGFTSLTSYVGTSVGGTSLKAAATTAVSETDSALAGGAIKIVGGAAVTVKATGGTAVSAITIGGTTSSAPTGAVDITSTSSAVTVTGGATVKVTETGATEGAVTVTGNAITTAVTVNQANTATAVTAVVAVAGVKAVTGVAAAPGTNKVTAVTGVDAVKAVAAVSSVVEGTVVIADVNAASTTAAGTITAVSLNGFGASSTITDNALTTLTLSGGATSGSTLTITDNLVAHAGGTTLALNTNAFKNTVSGATQATIADATVKTLNITNTGTSSILAVTDAALTTLTIAGSGVLTLPVAANTALTSIAVSGAAGFNDGAAGTTASGVYALGAAVAFTTTSSGAITATLDATTQSFVGSTGVDTIYINGNASKAITGGSSSTDELILTNTTASTYTLAKTGVNVTGFEILGIAGSVNNGVLNMSNFSSGLNTLHVISTGTVAVTNAAKNAAINIDVSTTSLTVAGIDTTGATDATTVTIGVATGAAPTSTAQTVGTLALGDANGIGFGTLNIVSNNVTQSSNADTAGANIITTLTDNGLAVLNVSGTGGLTITGLNEATTQSTSFTLNNTETNTAPVTITTLTNNVLGNLVFTGTNNSVIGTLVDTAVNVAISNTGTGTVTIGAWTASATSLTLTGSMNLTATASSLTSLTLADGQNVALTDANTTGITIAGAADNSHVTLVLGAAAATATNTVTLGNANNSITDATVAGKVNITVGTGSNVIDLHTGNSTASATYAATVTLGAHTAATGINSILVGAAGTNFGSLPSVIITGAVIGDTLTFTNATGTVTTTAQFAETTSVLHGLTLAQLACTASGTASFTFGGNTYIVNEAVTNTGATTTNVVELIGLHTLSSNVSGVTTLLT